MKYYHCLKCDYKWGSTIRHITDCDCPECGIVYRDDPYAIESITFDEFSPDAKKRQAEANKEQAEYEPFGEDWVKEMMKLRKDDLINMVRTAKLDNQKVGTLVGQLTLINGKMPNIHDPEFFPATVTDLDARQNTAEFVLCDEQLTLAILNWSGIADIEVALKLNFRDQL